jgi:hypothetical protein
MQMFQMSSAMAGAFAASAQEMSEKIRSIGANPLKPAVSPAEAEVSQETEPPQGGQS